MNMLVINTVSGQESLVVQVAETPGQKEMFVLGICSSLFVSEFY